MLHIENLCAGYGGSPVLNGFSLHLEPGAIAAVIGPNGCGKSTLLRCVAGLTKPISGTVAVGGDRIDTLSARDRARRVAMLPQNFEGGDHLTVEEMVALGRTPHLPPYATPSKSDREVIEQALGSVDLLQLRSRRMDCLSGGERQRVVLARALAQRPQLLLLDEPTSHLDIRYQFELLELARSLARREKLAVLLVLHQINLAAAVADQMVLLTDGGHTQAAGTPANVMTSQHLSAVYRVPLTVEAHPRSGRPQARADWVFAE